MALDYACSADRDVRAIRGRPPSLGSASDLRASRLGLHSRTPNLQSSRFIPTAHPWAMSSASLSWLPFRGGGRTKGCRHESSPPAFAVVLPPSPSSFPICSQLQRMLG